MRWASPFFNFAALASICNYASATDEKQPWGATPTETPVEPWGVPSPSSLPPKQTPSEPWGVPSPSSLPPTEFPSDPWGAPSSSSLPPTGTPADDESQTSGGDGKCHQEPNVDAVYDYIVVGAGAGGGIVATRLAEAGFQTLLLDAGPDFNSELTEIPLMWAKSTEIPEVEWRFRSINSAVDPGRDSVLYPRASMIGGCTMHNAMAAVYTFPDFWDNLKALTGDPEFDEEKMRKRFEKIERNEYRSQGSEGHGFDGFMSTSLPDTRLLTNFRLFDLQLIRVLTEFVLNFLPKNPVMNFVSNFLSFPECLPLIIDVNAPGFNSKEGAHLIPTSISKKDGWTRSSVYELIVKAQNSVNPLTVKTNSFVTKLLTQKSTIGGKPTVYGVKVQEGQALYEVATGAKSTGEVRTYVARKEVIVSGGTFNSPQILMLSGIGPKAELDRFNIETLVDLPGVGSNLSDKLEATLNWKATKDWKIYAQGCTFLEPTPEDDPCFDEFIEGNFPNPYTSSGTLLAIQKQTEKDYPDMYIQVAINEFRGYNDGWVETGYEATDSLVINTSTPRFGHTKGTVRLKSADPFSAVEIDFGGFDEEDLERTALVIEEIRKYGRRMIEQGMLEEETFPGSDADTFEKVKTWVRANGWGHHPLGTLKIGKSDDPMSVVDGHLRVYGVNSLRVVDASVFPEQPGFFPMVPIYMIAEKAAEDIIKADVTISPEVLGC